jgi:hypothetical protein
MNDLFTIRVVEIPMSILQTLCGSPFFRYEVLDPTGKIVAVCNEEERASQYCMTYNRKNERAT